MKLVKYQFVIMIQLNFIKIESSMSNKRINYTISPEIIKMEYIIIIYYMLNKKYLYDGK